MSGGRSPGKEKTTGLHDLKPTVWIGKQGVTESALQEIRDQVEKRKMVKVKWLGDAELDPASVAAATRTRLVQVRGKTLILADRKNPGK